MHEIHTTKDWQIQRGKHDKSDKHQNSKCYCYSANHEIFFPLLIKVLYKFGGLKEFFKEIRATANLLSFADMILHDKHQLKS